VDSIRNTGFICAESGLPDTVVIFASGGTAPYEYSFDGGNTYQSDSIYISASPDTLELALMDANGCTSLNDTLIIEESEPIVINDVATTDVTCAMAGTITIDATGGTGSLAYSINGGIAYQDSGKFNGLVPGDYDIMVRDSVGCPKVYGTVTIESTADIDLDFEITSISCGGAADGKIKVTATGGEAPYDYILKLENIKVDSIRSSGTVEFENLVPGNYSVWVTDNTNCTQPSGVIQIAQPEPVIIAEVVYDPFICPGHQGEVSIHANGGSKPYEYSIDGGNTFQADSTFTGLAADTFEIAARDANGCMTIGDTVILMNSPEIIVDNVLSDNPLCAGGNNGTIVITAHGGMGFLEYSIDGGINFQSDSLFTSLSAGSYEVYVRDSLGCVRNYSAPVTLNNPVPLTATIQTTNVQGGMNGTITITPSGGTAPYGYSIDNGSTFQNDSIFTGLAADKYYIVVQDSNNCTYADSATITSVQVLNVQVRTQDASCFGENDGLIIMEALDGTNGAIRYSIDDGETYQQTGNFPVFAGTYNIHVYDTATSRSFRDTVTINQPEEVTFSAQSNNSKCTDGNTGSITVSEVSGGIPPYTYDWSNGATSLNIDGLSPGIYTITVRDANNCPVQSSYVINADVKVEAFAGQDGKICYGTNMILTGSGSVNPGNNENLMYLWLPINDPNAITTVSNIKSNREFILSVTDTESGCGDTDTLVVDVYDSIAIEATASDTIVSTGSETNLDAIPVLGEFTGYYWMPTDLVSDTAAKNPTAVLDESTIFYVIASTENGCTAYDSIMIRVADDLEIFTGFTPNADGTNDYWHIEGAEAFPEIIVDVYNRWGEKVYESKGYNNSDAHARWDGTRKGKPMPIGTYYWVISKGDKTETLTGTVTIIR